MTEVSDVELSKEERKRAKKERKAAKRALEAQSSADAEPQVQDSPAHAPKPGKKRQRAEAADSTAVPEMDDHTDAVPPPEDAAAARKAAKAVKKKRKLDEAKAMEASHVQAADLDEESSPVASKKSKKGKSNGAVPGPPAMSTDDGSISTALGVTVEGMKVTPLTDFSNTGFSSKLVGYCISRKWSKPTPIQSHCWPVLNSGRDVVGIAETGSGKTLGFSFPALERMSKAKAISRSNPGPFMLVLAPTRELGIQSAEVITEAGKLCGITCVCVYGGVPKREQKAALSNGQGGVHVVVATPGRLKDLTQAGACDLSNVTYLVLDEADRMLDMGFEQDVREIIGSTNPKRQTAMFSATWPKSIRELAAEFLTNPVKVTVGDDDLTANTRVEQRVEVVQERDRDGMLLNLLRKYHGQRDNRVLVFVLYKKEAVRVESFLQRNGWDCVAVHGDKGQADREKALGKFKSKDCPLMIATDVAARGLDIPDVKYVINYSFPLTIEDYVHRIGRTGRAGKTGVSHTFFHQGDKPRAGELVNILMEANQVVPEALTKFGTHVKKKEHKMFGAFYRDVDSTKKATKTTFDSDEE